MASGGGEGGDGSSDADLDVLGMTRTFGRGEGRDGSSDADYKTTDRDVLGITRTFGGGEGGDGSSDADLDVLGITRTFGGGEGGDCSSDADLDVLGITRTFAKCKWFNTAKGFGFVKIDKGEQSRESDDDNEPDVFVYQTAIKMSGFRSLREGERVEVLYKKSDKGLEAVQVSGPDGSECLGSEKRPKRRKKTTDRCYNCDEEGHHAKECTQPPFPKKCHHCKSVYHLVAGCPLKRGRPTGTSQSEYTGHTASEQQRHLPHSNNHSTSLPPSTSKTG